MKDGNNLFVNMKKKHACFWADYLCETHLAVLQIIFFYFTSSFLSQELNPGYGGTPAIKYNHTYINL